MMDKLLVIGATGLLGYKAMELGSRSYEVYGTYNKNARNRLIHLDATNKKEITDVLNEITPDVVLDTHAITNLEYCEANPDIAWSINVEGSRNIAEASKGIGARYMFMSTDFVFDGRKDIYTEQDRTNPLNCYGRTKLAAEELIMQLDMDSTIVRTASIYGAVSSTGKKSFVQWVIESLQKGERIKVISDLFNSPTFNEDLTEIIFKLHETGSDGIFHVVGKDNISKYDFAVQISKEFGLDSGLIEPIKSSELASTLVRPNRVKLSTEKVERVTGMTPVGVKAALSTLHKEISGNGK